MHAHLPPRCERLVMPKRLRSVAMIEVWSNGTALDSPKIVPGAT
jgi:hypothetical protein